MINHYLYCEKCETSQAPRFSNCLKCGGVMKVRLIDKDARIAALEAENEKLRRELEESEKELAIMKNEVQQRRQWNLDHLNEALAAQEPA